MKAYTNKKRYVAETLAGMTGHDENMGLLACLCNLRAELDRILSDDDAWGITPMECRRKIVDGLREKIRDIVERRKNE